MLIVKGHDERFRTEHEARRMIAYETASLIHFAVCNPKKMPKYQPAKRSRPAATLPQEVQNDIVRAWFMSKVPSHG